MSVAWVLIFRKSTTGSRFYEKIILPLSKASYGMYLCHMLLLGSVSAWIRSALGTGCEGIIGHHLEITMPEWKNPDCQTSIEDHPHSNVMLSIFRRRIPDGVLASTVSPTFLPMRAAPIGDFREIFPASRFIS